MTTPVPQGLTDVAVLVDQRLAELFRAERRTWAAVDPRLVEAIDELERMASGGKRLRAAYAYWGWLGATGQEAIPLDACPDGPNPDRIVDVCAAFELLQAFALIHDDIMDDADTRRGERTIHAAQAELVRTRSWRGEARRYGEGVAILIGDLSHVYADQLIGNDSDQARGIWDQLRIELNLGQYLDMRTAAAAELDRATAQRVATFKSALYTIVRPLQLGAVLAAPISQAMLGQLEDYGRPAGQAFQLRDDLLGVLGDETRVGKPVGNDLREGKPTELVAAALERASTAERKVLETIGDPTLSDAQVAELVEILQKTGAVDEIERRIEELAHQATTVAHRLPFAEPVRETLSALARYVAARQH